MTGIKWGVTPQKAVKELTEAQNKVIYDAALAVAVGRMDDIALWLNEAIPWHPTPWSLHIEEPEEPLDMICYVIADPKTINIHLSHGDYFGDPVEETLDAELSYVPDGVDFWGPVIMQEIGKRIGLA